MIYRMTVFQEHLKFLQWKKKYPLFLVLRCSKVSEPWTMGPWIKMLLSHKSSPTMLCFLSFPSCWPMQVILKVIYNFQSSVKLHLFLKPLQDPIFEWYKSLSGLIWRDSSLIWSVIISSVISNQMLGNIFHWYFHMLIYLLYPCFSEKKTCNPYWYVHMCVCVCLCER